MPRQNTMFTYCKASKVVCPTTSWLEAPGNFPTQLNKSLPYKKFKFKCKINHHRQPTNSSSFIIFPSFFLQSTFLHPSTPFLFHLFLFIKCYNYFIATKRVLFLFYLFIIAHQLFPVLEGCNYGKIMK